MFDVNGCCHDVMFAEWAKIERIEGNFVFIDIATLSSAGGFLPHSNRMAAEPEISGKPRNTSLLKYILPIDIDFEFENRLMPTEFSKSLFWRSLYIVGPSQIQRLGLLFQVQKIFFTSFFNPISTYSVF